MSTYTFDAVAEPTDLPAGTIAPQSRTYESDPITILVGTWLGTEFDKRSYFMRRLRERVKQDEFPRLTFGAPRGLCLRPRPAATGC
jgi:hypothetical protein